MNTWQTLYRRFRLLRWPMIFLAVLSISAVASLPVLAVSMASTRYPHRAAPMLALSALDQALPLNAVQVKNAPANSEDVDPTFLIANPQAFDSRPCVMQSNSANCDGIYPSVPPHIAIVFAHRLGAGACFDQTSTIVEMAPIDTQADIGVIQLWYFPRCQSWSTQVLFHIPVSQIQQVSVEVDQEDMNGFWQWWNSWNQLPPPIAVRQISKLQPFNQLSAAEQHFYMVAGLFSPLLYSVGTPTASNIRLNLTNGVGYNLSTSWSQAQPPD
ncbi:MAG: hypothetical protein ACRDHZ_23435 [Ktedonobacteraceae bacterium]